MFGSKWLLSELSRLGFSITYDEVTRYKQSVVQSEPAEDFLHNIGQGCFTQWVADNVDHNVGSLDGHGSFHGMGIISATISAEDVIDRRIPRLHRVPVKELVRNAGIPITPYVRPDTPDGSTLLTFKPLVELDHPEFLPASLNLDTIWDSGWFCKDTTRPRPNWSGFMQTTSTGLGRDHPVSSIQFLPMIDLDPGDPTCIYSTLLFVERQALKLNIETACITFDQPLWLKAMEIISSKRLKVVCRLGGFHTLMSFLGSIGQLMAGAGLEEAMQTCYGSNTTAKMMTGKAFARALRGHFLVASALRIKLIRLACSGEYSSESMEDNAIFSQEDMKELCNLYEGLLRKEITDTDVLDSMACIKLDEILQLVQVKLTEKSRTAKLWFLYLEYVQIVKNFIRAERIGDWNLHLTTLRQMLNLFAATGHHNYAKCARLYLQLMSQLEETNPWLYDQFMQGKHSIRRSDRYWGGLSTDLVIEQVLMRSVKTRGGLTRGRGITESVRTTWINSMHRCAKVHECMTQVTNLPHTTSSDQHVELGTSRSKRDNEDLIKILNWLDDHDPFDTSTQALRCVSSGVCASEFDNINCDQAEQIGSSIQAKLDQRHIQEVSIKRSENIKPLQCIQKGVKLGSVTIHIDTNILFSRLTLMIERSDDMRSYFKYELTPVPTSLFHNDFMRKTDKAALARTISEGKDQLVKTPRYVVDGGALLHRVRWLKNTSYQDVFEQYATDIRTRYGTQVTIVFDGYNSGPSIKDHEQRRRSSTTGKAPDVKFHPTMKTNDNQSMFLANSNNKKLFISLLSHHLTERGYEVIQATSDADTVIVKSALEMAKDQPVTVVADDTDVLILLIHHHARSRQNLQKVYLRSEVKCTNVRRKLKFFDVEKIGKQLGDVMVKHILFVHAWGGCDTTSAIYGQGKLSIMKKLQESTVVQGISSVFCNVTSSETEIAEAGTRLLVMLYGGKGQEDLTTLRHATYTRMLAKCSTRPRPEALPPTTRAAYYHLLRVHLQIIEWTSLMSVQKDPRNWGWVEEKGKFEPILTDLDPGPDDLLNVVRCNCKTSTQNQCGTSSCSCKKNGLKCVSACGECHGNDCKNAVRVTLSLEDEVDELI